MLLRSWQQAILAVLLFSGVSANVAPQPCPGDCTGDGAVTVGEIITGVNIALGSRPLSSCTAMDTNGDGQVGIPDLIRAVRALLEECSGAPASPTPAGTAQEASPTVPTSTPESTSTSEATSTAASSSTPTPDTAPTTTPTPARTIPPGDAESAAFSVLNTIDPSQPRAGETPDPGLLLGDAERAGLSRS
jgi:hypothetical protein